jgi:hypothetical protein
MENKVNDYSFKLLKSTDVGKSKQSTIMFSRNDNLQMEADEVKGIYESIKTKAEKDKTKKVKFAIRALVGDKYATLKRLDSELDVQDFEEYYEGRVQDSTKFEKFSQVQLVFWTSEVKQKGGKSK